MSSINYYINGRIRKEYIDDSIEWCSNKALSEHCNKHVINGDDIEKDTFIDIHNKINKHDIISLHEDLGNSIATQDRYENISKEVINNSSIGYKSKDKIAIIGDNDLYRYSTYIGTEYDDAIVASYPSYISDRFWLLPYIDKKILNGNSDIFGQKLEFVKAGGPPSFKDKLKNCLTMYEQIIDDSVFDEDNSRDVIGFLLAYCYDDDNYVRIKKLYSELFKKGNKLELKEEFLKRTRFFIKSQLSSRNKNGNLIYDNEGFEIHELKYNKELYSEQILTLYILSKYKKYLDETIINDKKLSVDHEVLYADVNKIKYIDKYILEMPLLISWVKLAFKDLKTKEKYSYINDFTAFEYVDRIYLTNIALRIIDHYNESLGLNVNELIKEYRVHRDKYISKLNDPSVNKDIVKWNDLYRKIFRINLSVIRFNSKFSKVLE